MDYLSDNLKHHNWWAYRYFFCEFLALINVIGEFVSSFIIKYNYQCIFKGQMFLMDRFFDGAFLTFGLEVIAFAEQDQEDRLDPLIYVFPRMTKVSSPDHDDKEDLLIVCILLVHLPQIRNQWRS